MANKGTTRRGWWKELAGVGVAVAATGMGRKEEKKVLAVEKVVERDVFTSASSHTTLIFFEKD